LIIVAFILSIFARTSLCKLIKKDLDKIQNRWKSNKDKPQVLKRILKHISNNKQIKARQAEQVHQEVFEEADCLKCANCCKSIPPIVSKRDQNRISKHLGMESKVFFEKYLVQDEDGDTVLNQVPCPFLKTDNNCSIYEVRPSACRQYPHSGEFTFHQNFNLHKRNAKYCPALFEILHRLANVK